MTEHRLVTHAKNELKLLGEDPEVSESIVKAVEGFISYPGHSGGSAQVARSHLLRILNERNLAPLTSDPDEWEDKSEFIGKPMWQNKRDSMTFSEDGGETWWTLDDYTPELHIDGFDSEMTASYVCCYDHNHEKIDVRGLRSQEVAAILAEHDNGTTTPAWISVWEHTPLEREAD